MCFIYVWMYNTFHFIGPPCTWLYDSCIYNYLCSQYLSPLMLCVRISIRARYTTLCHKVCQWLATGRCFSPGPTVSSTDKTDYHGITEILLKVASSKLTNLTIWHFEFWNNDTFTFSHIEALGEFYPVVLFRWWRHCTNNNVCSNTQWFI